MDANQNIKITIAGRPYRLSVKLEEEEIVRKAADYVNQTILEYSKAFEYKDHQDLFAMIALQTSANSIRLEEERSFRNKDLEIKLSEIDEVLSTYLQED
jgi:cell division protein ZapA (FtsZ GTPase activity inhibitor)